MRRCSICQKLLSLQRLRALPTTQVCVQCSTETPVRGFMTWEHKTAPTFQVVTPEQHAWLQQYDRKRPAASLPMSAKTTTAIMHTSSANVSVRPTDVHASDPESNLSLIPRARCGHSERPQVGPSGKCVECAIAYYAVRAKYATIRIDS